MVPEKGGLYKDQKAILKDFMALLAQRPVWTSAALKERVSGFTDVEFEWMLPRIAYMFRNGMAYTSIHCAPRTLCSSSARRAVKGQKYPQLLSWIWTS